MKHIERTVALQPHDGCSRSISSQCTMEAWHRKFVENHLSQQQTTKSVQRVLWIPKSNSVFDSRLFCQVLITVNYHLIIPRRKEARLFPLFKRVLELIRKTFTFYMVYCGRFSQLLQVPIKIPRHACPKYGIPPYLNVNNLLPSPAWLNFSIMVLQITLNLDSTYSGRRYRI